MSAANFNLTRGMSAQELRRADLIASRDKTTIGISRQERWLLDCLESGGSMRLKQLQARLPDEDQRSPRVKAASLCRSLRRMITRGLVTISGGSYIRMESGADTAGVAGRPKAPGLRRAHPAEYRSWRAMLNRCTNPHNNRCKSHGGAGVKVCDRWDPAKGGSFKNFYADMGPRPEGATNGRIGDAGNYEPTNCKWMTSEEQAANRNRRKTRRGASLVEMVEMARRSLRRFGKYAQSTAPPPG
jgi:hypothetical protein